jgi:hypothetical protein
MATYTTFDYLRMQKTRINEALVLKGATATILGKTIFLSHSSKDDEILSSVIKILEDHGGKTYVDKKDNRLPEVVSEETAEILRQTIRQCKKLVVLVSANTRDSKWVPWELGIGDEAKKTANVAIFPVVEKALESTWAEQEYLGLYRRILRGKIAGKSSEEWIVWDHKKNTASTLLNWLSY